MFGANEENKRKRSTQKSETKVLIHKHTQLLFGFEIRIHDPQKRSVEKKTANASRDKKVRK